MSILCKCDKSPLFPRCNKNPEYCPKIAENKEILKHADGIYEIKNFLTNEEIDNLLISIDDDKFVFLHEGFIVIKLKEQSLNYIQNIENRIFSYFSNADSLTPIRTISRLKEKEFIHSHTDGGYPDSLKKIIFGVVIYLNDDFSGGQINYPDLKIKIQPTRSSLLIHEAQIKHEVLPVISGKRYALTTFVFGDESTIIDPNIGGFHGKPKDNTIDIWATQESFEE